MCFPFVLKAHTEHKIEIHFRLVSSPVKKCFHERCFCKERKKTKTRNIVSDKGGATNKAL